MSEPRVVFFQVKEPQAKLSKIAEIARIHFEKKEPFLIIVPDVSALEFVDQLLWRFPEESFLPHITSEEPTRELLVITTQKYNLNGAVSIFNLCSDALLLKEPIKVVFDFEDLSSPEKKALSEKRFHAYREAKFAISSN